jgi:hypothetical protein
LSERVFLDSARSFWTGRDVSSAEVHGLLEPLARLPSPFEMPVARKEEPLPDEVGSRFCGLLIRLHRSLDGRLGGA